MRRYKIERSQMRLYEIIWDDMRWHDTKWDCIKYNKVRWDYMRSYEMKLNRMKWDYMMRWYEVIWVEVKRVSVSHQEKNVTRERQYTETFQVQMNANYFRDEKCKRKMATQIFLFTDVSNSKYLGYFYFRFLFVIAYASFFIYSHYNNFNFVIYYFIMLFFLF